MASRYVGFISVRRPRLLCLVLRPVVFSADGRCEISGGRVRQCEKITSTVRDEVRLAADLLWLIER